VSTEELFVAVVFVTTIFTLLVAAGAWLLG
jgi:hypothetical protein